ncbi:uncharacterized protein [Apostichopus japonicus]|uniref:uncharacterized protein n=1 Tax=Stichopus japonicus TaxID=307972 RepID=UPI003AB41FC7
MNDLDIGMQSEISKFADDTKVMCPIRNIGDQQKLQQDLIKLMIWTKKWQMKFNVDKCSVMHFGHANPKFKYKMGDQELQETEEEKDLGVYVNSSMKFSRQCAESVKKANRMIGIIKRNFTNFDRKVVLNLYKALVRPHLDYYVPVWKPYLRKDIQLLEGVQRRMTKIIHGMRNKTYEERLKELRLMTIEQRHLRQDMITFYNITQGSINMQVDNYVDILRESNTRGHTMKIRPSRVRLEVRRNSYFKRIWKAWNTLPQEAVTAQTLNKFKNSIADCGIFKGRGDLLSR